MRLMRRLFGCFFTLLLIGTVFLVLIARGPGLKSLPLPIGLEPLVDVVGQSVVGSSQPAPPPPAPAR